MTAQAATSHQAVEREDIDRKARERLLVYLGRLGLSDPELIETLVSECLDRAGKPFGTRGSDEEVLRRGIDEAQALFDARLGKALDLNPSRDQNRIAGARAALLLCGGQPTDFLFRRTPDENPHPPSWAARLPDPVPPEAPVAMPVQKLEFVFFKSS